MAAVARQADAAAAPAAAIDRSPIIFFCLSGAAVPAASFSFPARLDVVAFLYC
jgi:hypothetical protein